MCFLAAPVHADTSQITNSLLQRNIAFTRINTQVQDTAVLLRDTIQKCDFVCIFSPDAFSSNLIFEMGVAIGLGKRIFMVAAESAQVPVDLRAITYVIADRWTSNIIGPHLDAFLSTLPRKPAPKASKKTSSSPTLDFRKERRNLEEFGRNINPINVERFVETLFRKAGINVVPSPIEDFGADFAIVSPSISHRFRNPILVEIKKSARLSDVVFAVEKLVALIDKGRGSAALLVTLETLPKNTLTAALSGSRQVPVLILTVAELIATLERGSLIDDVLNTTS
jgi:hypothetical protein